MRAGRSHRVGGAATEASAGLGITRRVATRPAHARAASATGGSAGPGSVGRLAATAAHPAASAGGQPQPAAERPYARQYATSAVAPANDPVAASAANAAP